VRSEADSGQFRLLIQAFTSNVGGGPDFLHELRGHDDYRMPVRYGDAIELRHPVEGGLDLVKLSQFTSVGFDFNSNLLLIGRYCEEVESSPVG
jgi:hypothetical protein